VIEAYRLHSSRYPANSGKGAAIRGGRWNPVAMEAIYTATSRSLAALEILAHYSVLPKDFVVTPVRIPDSLVYEVRLDMLPSDWQADQERTADLGMRWLRDSRFAVLSVPSVVIPAERNYILNPAHPQFTEIEFLAFEPFHFDPRLRPLGPAPQNPGAGL
jgi:RES domain-containing protein